MPPSPDGGTCPSGTNSVGGGQTAGRGRRRRIVVAHAPAATTTVIATSNQIHTTDVPPLAARPLASAAEPAGACSAGAAGMM